MKPSAFAFYAGLLTTLALGLALANAREPGGAHGYGQYHPPAYGYGPGPAGPGAWRPSYGGPDREPRGGRGYGYGFGYDAPERTARPGGFRASQRNGRASSQNFPRDYAPPAPRSYGRGGFLPPGFGDAAVADPRAYHLRRPPNGYLWVHMGPNAYLAQRSTGMILDTAPLY